MDYYILHATIDTFLRAAHKYWIKLNHRYSLKFQLDYTYSELNVSVFFESFVAVVVDCNLPVQVFCSIQALEVSFTFCGARHMVLLML